MVKYVAHRGLSMHAPENTLPAFELAGQQGIWAIECDTYCTTDGRWVVHHDRTVDRMTDGSGAVQDFTFEDIRKLNIVSGADIGNHPGLRIPVLEEVLAVCKKYGLHAFVEIELYHGDEDLASLLHLVESCGMIGHCSFICFNADDLRKVRKIHADVPLGYLSWKPVIASDIEIVKELGGAFLNYHYSEITERDIRQCHEADIKVSVWIVNDEDEARRLIEAGVDYVTTDTKLHIAIGDSK